MMQYVAVAVSKPEREKVKLKIVSQMAFLAAAELPHYFTNGEKLFMIKSLAALSISA